MFLLLHSFFMQHRKVCSKLFTDVIRLHAIENPSGCATDFFKIICLKDCYVLVLFRKCIKWLYVNH